MIKKVILNNFLSHTNTSLEFNNGITVFVGHNGSGKSSIIDSITFALFDQHTRKSNKNLLTKGLIAPMSTETGSFVMMDFSVGSNIYRLKRQIDNQGKLVSARLDQYIKQDLTKKMHSSGLPSTPSTPSFRPILSGERKQLGESVINEIQAILGIDYSKLQIAGIIHQGEISKIVDSQPKEFKELLNNMIGLDRLDKAFASMHDIISEFRSMLREKTNGYDDNQINILIKKNNDNKSKLADSQRVLEIVNVELSEKMHEITKIEREIEDLEPKIIKLGELKTLENTLLNYFREKSIFLKKEIEKLKELISLINKSVLLLKNKEEVLVTMQMVISEKDELNNDINKVESEIGKLNGYTDCAKKIQIKDGKCPICNSEISKINQMFDINHITKQLQSQVKKKNELLSELSKINKEELDLRQKERNIIAAENSLSAHGVTQSDDLNILQIKLSDLIKDLKLLSDIKFDNLQGKELSFYKIDDYSARLIDEILSMRKEVVDVDMSYMNKVKVDKTKLSADLLHIQNKKAVFEKTISDLTCENEDLEILISNLSAASKYISDLEIIRSTVFNRDGIVSSSLRTWALNLISVKASDYISTFNVGISKISLIEKPREIKILCYGKRGEVETFSLSGGEKVAVALAIRMGISFLMGASNLDFVILDEPTTNLDEERRRSFVKIISDLFNKGPGPISQMIIITHDEEIFENSEIDQIYRFSMTDRGSIVNLV